MNEFIVEGIKEDTGFKGFGFCDELCPYCEKEVFNIPSDRISLCPHCGAQLFPCAACDKRCSWDQKTLKCSRFTHSKAFIESQKEDEE